MPSQPKWLQQELKQLKQRWWAAMGAHHIAELQPKRAPRQRGAADTAAIRAETARAASMGGAAGPTSCKNATKTPISAASGSRNGCVSSRNGHNRVGGGVVGPLRCRNAA